jgi:aldehyde dehydrogenase (NAD+)
MPPAVMPTTDVSGVFVDNARRAGAGGRLPLIDPSTGEEFAAVDCGSVVDVSLAVSAARAAAGAWAASAPLERARLCARIGRLILDRADSLVEIGVHDAGLPRSLARRDVEAAARYFEFYAGVPDKLHGESIPLGDGVADFTVREPWGVCAIVLPFNFPFQLTARDLAAALCTGNTSVLKPPEQAPLAALAITELCAEAGAPAGVVNAVTGLGAETGEALVRHPDVDHITFTGSVPTARRVLEAAAQGIKPSTIELGGKSPHVVFADAPFAKAIAAIVNTTFRTAGQACSAGTRVLVERGAHDEVVSALVAAVSALRVGAADDDPDVGPLISTTQRDRVLDALAAARSDGGEILTGGAKPAEGSVPSGGFYVEPTVIAATASAAVSREEIFGPVVAVTPFDAEEEAVALANGTDYGLVAGIWTAQLGRAHRLASSIQAGQIFVNSYGVGGGVELPFGGYRRSGFGRIKGIAGALEYTQLKNVCIDFGAA